jgi:hypothetical protein
MDQQCRVVTASDPARIEPHPVQIHSFNPM